jgi:chitinase
MRFLFGLIISVFLLGFNKGLGQAQPFEVIAYYSGDGKDIEQYSIDKLTQIIFSFLQLKNDTLHFHNDEKKAALQRVVALKNKFPKLKVLISLGGWGGCATCSEVFSNPASRTNFASSVSRIMKEYQVDGIDLDWEYPSIKGYPDHAFKKEDKDNFTQLIADIRQAIGPKGELSFAAGGFTEYLEQSIDWKAVMPLVNRVNLMTYDLVHGFSTQTGHHTPLYSTAQQRESIENCVQWLVRNKVPPAKLVIGAAFYARIWEQVDQLNWGLYKSGKFKQSLDYRHFDQMEPDSGWAHQWDNVAMAPYAYHKTRHYFATYDNGMSLYEKVKYAHENRLGGIMFWELLCDIPKAGLLNQLAEAVEKFYGQ